LITLPRRFLQHNSGRAHPPLSAQIDLSSPASSITALFHSPRNNKWIPARTAIKINKPQKFVSINNINSIMKGARKKRTRTKFNRGGCKIVIICSDMIISGGKGLLAMSTRDNLTVCYYIQREEFCWRPGCFRLETSIKQVHMLSAPRIIWWEASEKSY
jgi:hypothetical protein